MLQYRAFCTPSLVRSYVYQLSCREFRYTGKTGGHRASEPAVRYGGLANRYWEHRAAYSGLWFSCAYRKKIGPRYFELARGGQRWLSIVAVAEVYASLADSELPLIRELILRLIGRPR